MRSNDFEDSDPFCSFRNLENIRENNQLTHSNWASHSSFYAVKATLNNIERSMLSIERALSHIERAKPSTEHNPKLLREETD